MEDLRYPIGKFSHQGVLTEEARRACIRSIEEAPARYAAAVGGLTPGQLDAPYREGGWSVRQTVHHVADSHINAYCRFKLAMTEENPTIKPYIESLWAETADSRIADVGVSLVLIEKLHARWVLLLRSMTPGDFGRKLVHPESGPMDLDRLLALYSWHGRHHEAHIVNLRKRQGWQ
jgi:uncharacterized damage-inducible protein DinB